MSLETFLLKKFGRLKESIIDIMIQDWIDLEENDLKALYHWKYLRRLKYARHDYKKLKEVHESLQQQFFDRFGFPEETKILIKKREARLKLSLQFIDNPKDRRILNKIAILDEEIEMLVNKPHENTTFYEMVCKVEKHFPFGFDLARTPLVQLFNRINAL